ncbi:UNVERIFIED_CONTAM: hypothetical protein PYX00_001185 [Menopon gallinae]|uniref:Uncharacterized protein n=1 Tax=Menopon gallinae TaxID=328185 RepID=A0AAW2IBY9_9NEOP
MNLFRLSVLEQNLYLDTIIPRTKQIFSEVSSCVQRVAEPTEKSITPTWLQGIMLQGRRVEKTKKGSANAGFETFPDPEVVEYGATVLSEDGHSVPIVDFERGVHCRVDCKINHVTTGRTFFLKN